MKVFISGKISDDPDYYYKFAKAEEFIRSCGYDCFNPARLIDNPSHKYVFDRWNDSDPEGVWEYFMSLSRPEWELCSILYILPGWFGSRGVEVEELAFLKAGKKIIYTGDALKGGV